MATYNIPEYYKKFSKLCNLLTTEEQKQAFNEYLNSVSSIQQQNNNLDELNEELEDALNYVCHELEWLTGISWLEIKSRVIEKSKETR